jgi:alpha-ketoglutarate-dependent taurine dioxygenase
MKSNLLSAPNLAGLKKARVLRPDELVRSYHLQPGTGLPLVISPNIERLELVPWAASHRDYIQKMVLNHGGLLFRNFHIAGAEGFYAFVAAAAGEPLEYVEQTSPRHKVHGNIYTSTEYPAEQRIFLHNENSYSSTWPLKILFFCTIAPEQGGETPIADIRGVTSRIPVEIREAFAQKGWMLVRNFGTGFGLSWQTAFQTSEPEEVTRRCQQSGIHTEWLSRNQLRIRQRRPAFAKHPHTGEQLWFNHATFFHISTLDPKIREGLVSEFAEEDLPYNTYYGDGSPISLKTMELLRQAYETETVKFSWQKDDLLLLDNMLVAHGRAPFSGPRQILVAMTEPHSA